MMERCSGALVGETKRAGGVFFKRGVVGSLCRLSLCICAELGGFGLVSDSCASDCI